MASVTDPFDGVTAVSAGLGAFADALAEQGAPVLAVDWHPPAGGDPAAVALLTRLWGEHGDRVAAANRAVLERIEGVTPRAVTVAPAARVIPVLADRAKRTLLHAGPPIVWERMCDPQRRAVVAACLFEGWAADRDHAARLVADGDVTLACGNEHGHVGAMTGVCSPSMPVWVVEDRDAGVRACSTLNEGPGDTLWFGVGNDEAVARLRFLHDETGPLLARVLAREGPVDVFALAAQALLMGDELHMRSQAAGGLLLRELAGGLVAVAGEAAEVRERAALASEVAEARARAASAGAWATGESAAGEPGEAGGLAAGAPERVARYLAANHHAFLPLTMAAAKCASLAASGPGTAGSSIVALIARNGTDVGIQLAGLPGRWFTAPAAPVQDALLREGFDAADAALDIGDSAVIECMGLGGMALAAAPAIAAFFSGAASDAVARNRLMGEICAARSRRFRVPALDDGGTPLGIDARLVLELGVTPQISTGVLHASSGAGQIGAGVAHQPLEPFRAAAAALADELAREPAPAATVR